MQGKQLRRNTRKSKALRYPFKSAARLYAERILIQMITVHIRRWNTFLYEPA